MVLGCSDEENDLGDTLGLPCSVDSDCDRGQSCRSRPPDDLDMFDAATSPSPPQCVINPITQPVAAESITCSTICDEMCVNLNWDRHHCGQCGRACPDMDNGRQPFCVQAQCRDPIDMIEAGLQTWQGAQLVNIDLQGLDLRGFDFSRANLSGADFSGADLEGTDFSDANLQGANFDGALLRDVILSGALVSNTTFNDSVLTGVRSGGMTGCPRSLPPPWACLNGLLLGPKADLSATQLTGANLLFADLEGANLKDARWTQLQAYQINLSGADLTRATLSGDFTRADLSQVTTPSSLDGTFRDADLSGADLTNTHMEGDFSAAHFGDMPPTRIQRCRAMLPPDWVCIPLHENRRANLLTPQISDLRGLDLRDAYFEDIDLSQSDFRGANLSGARFSGIDLTTTNFEGANLTGASFTQVTLTNTDLRGLTLTNTSFINSDLSHAQLAHLDLTGARFFSSNLSHADFSDATLTNTTLADSTLDGAHLQGTDLTSTSIQHIKAGDLRSCPAQIHTNQHVCALLPVQGKRHLMGSQINMEDVELSGEPMVTLPSCPSGRPPQWQCHESTSPANNVLLGPGVDLTNMPLDLSLIHISEPTRPY